MFKEKRKIIQSKLQAKEAFLLVSNPTSHISGDTFHPYIQSPDFFYLTGCMENPCALYIDQENIVFFTTPKDPTQELWDGKMLGFEGAKKLGFQQVFPFTNLQEKVSKFLQNKETLYCDYFHKPQWDHIIRSLIEKPKSRNHTHHLGLKDTRILLHPLRNLKTHKFEIEALRKVCKITANAYKNLLLQLKNFSNEGEIEAFFFSELKKNSCAQFSYSPICAADENSCTLHYRDNNKKIKNFVLLDVGFRQTYFNSDITRTYPFKKRFNKEQETIYNIVLECEKYIIKSIVPGKDTLNILKARTLEYFTQELKLFKLSHKITDYFPHGLGHSLGHDVHDVLDKDAPLMPGHVITVEPGLYFRFPNDPKNIRNFGVRIEDNILIGHKTHENLTKAASKELKEIYKIMKL